jgi:hypothetical protein
VAAAGQAEVGAADPQPPVGGRVGDHRLDELTVGLLEGLALGKRAARLGEATGERVAQFLQLTEVEHPRRPHGGHPVRDEHPSQPLGDQPGELPLELADLPPQLRAREPLVYRASLQHSSHSQSLSRLEGRRGNP